MHVKVIGGTPRSDRESLCNTCEYFKKATDENGRIYTECQQMSFSPRTKIQECKSYEQISTIPFVYRTAWILENTYRRGRRYSIWRLPDGEMVNRDGTPFSQEESEEVAAVKATFA